MRFQVTVKKAGQQAKHYDFIHADSFEDAQKEFTRQQRVFVSDMDNVSHIESIDSFLGQFDIEDINYKQIEEDITENFEGPGYYDSTSCYTPLLLDSALIDRFSWDTTIWELIEEPVK